MWIAGYLPPCSPYVIKGWYIAKTIVFVAFFFNSPSISINNFSRVLISHLSFILELLSQSSRNHWVSKTIRCTLSLISILSRGQPLFGCNTSASLKRALRKSSSSSKPSTPPIQSRLPGSTTTFPLKSFNASTCICIPLVARAFAASSFGGIPEG